jgi:hypothetical protein
MSPILLGFPIYSVIIIIFYTYKSHFTKQVRVFQTSWKWFIVMIFLPTERPILRLDAEDVKEIEKLKKSDWNNDEEYLDEVWNAIFLPTERPILRLDAEDVKEIEKLKKDDWNNDDEYRVWIAIFFLMLPFVKLPFVNCYFVFFSLREVAWSPSNPSRSFPCWSNKQVGNVQVSVQQSIMQRDESTFIINYGII